MLPLLFFVLGLKHHGVIMCNLVDSSSWVWGAASNQKTRTLLLLGGWVEGSTYSSNLCTAKNHNKHPIEY